MYAGLFIFVEILLVAAAAVSQPCMLPAYAHNDYINAMPLTEALQLGFRGVEVDYFLVDGELRVGHEQEETTAGRNVESLYLAPLRDFVEQVGPVCPGGLPFLLNIESKLDGLESYQALHQLLSRYEDILTTVRAGVVQQGPIQVVLVGWFPDLDYLLDKPVRYVAVQAHYSDLPPDHGRYPAHLLKLISLNYNQKTISRGMEPVSQRLKRRLDLLISVAREKPGRWVRVYNVPSNQDTYDDLIETGIDLIGTKDIRGARRLLTGGSRERR